MMRLSLSALFLVSASALVTASLAVGQTAAAAPKAAAPAAIPAPKVAVVMFQAAVTQTNEFQRDVADLQRKYDPRKAELKKLNDEIDSLNKQMQNAQLSDAEKGSRARILDEKKKELDRDTQDAQTDFQNDMQQTVNGVAQKVGATMTDYADKHGYTLVLDAGEEQAQTVLYAVPSTDITKEIIEAYNQKSGVAAPAAQAEPDAPQPQTQPATK